MHEFGTHQTLISKRRRVDGMHGAGGGRDGLLNAIFEIVVAVVLTSGVPELEKPVGGDSEVVSASRVSVVSWPSVYAW